MVLVVPETKDQEWKDRDEQEAALRSTIKAPSPSPPRT